MPLHASLKALVGLPAGSFNDPGREECLEEQDHDGDHERAANELPQRELPTHEHREEDTELKNQVCGGELKRHRGGEVCALAEDRTCEGDGGIGAGRGCGPKAASYGNGSRRVVRQEAAHPFLGHNGLNNCRKSKAENQWPKNLPGHHECHCQSAADPAHRTPLPGLLLQYPGPRTRPVDETLDSRPAFYRNRKTLLTGVKDLSEYSVNHVTEPDKQRPGALRFWVKLISPDEHELGGAGLEDAHVLHPNGLDPRHAAKDWGAGRFARTGA